MIGTLTTYLKMHYDYCCDCFATLILTSTAAVLRRDIVERLKMAILTI